MKDSFEVILLPEAEKNLKKLPEEVEEKLLEILQCFKTSPFFKGKKIRKIQTLFPTHYELKEGDYRILFRVEKKKVIIKLIIHRKDLEKELKQLR